MLVFVCVISALCLIEVVAKLIRLSQQIYDAPTPTRLVQDIYINLALLLWAAYLLAQATQ